MKKNVSGQKIGGQLITAADGTAFTGSVTVAVTGDAGTQATGSVGSGACVSEGNGYHTYAPAQAETNYDLIAFTFTGTGAIPATVQVYTSFPQTVDNNVLAAGATGFAAIDTVVDTINTNVGTAGAGLTNLGASGNNWNVGKTGYTVSAIGSGVITATSIASNAFTAVKFAASSLNGKGDWNIGKTGYALSTAGILAIWHQAMTAITTAGTVGKLLKDEITSARMAVLTDWINGGRLDLLVDDIISKLPAALVSGRMASNVAAIDDSTTAAVNLAASANKIIVGTTSGTPTTTSCETNLTGYADSELVDGVVYFADGQRAIITSYAETSGVIGYAAITTAPDGSLAIVVA